MNKTHDIPGNAIHVSLGLEITPHFHVKGQLQLQAPCIHVYIYMLWFSAKTRFQ